MKNLVGKAALIFIVSGIVCIAEGMAICMRSAFSFNGLSYLFGFPLIIQGLAQFIYGTAKGPEHPWTVARYLGIVNMILGYFISFYPPLTGSVFILIIGVVSVSNGIAMLLLGFYLYRESQPERYLFLSGTFSIITGSYLLINLQKALLPMLWITGIYEFVFGTMVVLFGIRARGWRPLYVDHRMVKQPARSVRRRQA